MRPHVRRTSRWLLVIVALMALTALVPSVGLARVERKGAVACQAKAAPSCCCPKEKSLSGDCCCKAKSASDCNLGSAPCSADETDAAVVMAQARAELTPALRMARRPADFRLAPTVARDAELTRAANPATPPPQSTLAS